MDSEPMAITAPVDNTIDPDTTAITSSLDNTMEPETISITASLDNTTIGSPLNLRAGNNDEDSQKQPANGTSAGGPTLEERNFVYVVQETYQRLETKFFKWGRSYPTRTLGVYTSLKDANNWAIRLWDEYRHSPVWVPGGWGGNGMHVAHGVNDYGCFWWKTVSGADSDQRLGWIRVEKCCINGPTSEMPRVWVEPVIGVMTVEELELYEMEPEDN
jgi:hypothetical protein